MKLHFLHNKSILFTISQRRIESLRESEQDIPDGATVFVLCVNAGTKTFASPIYGRLERYVESRNRWFMTIDGKRMDKLEGDVVVPQEQLTDEDKLLLTTLRLANILNRTDQQ